MSATALQPPPAERLARIIDGLCAAIAARGIGGLLTAPLIFLLWGRLKRAALRARRLAAKLAAGKPLAAPRRRNPEPSRPGRPPPPRLPRGYAWVIRLVPAAAPAASQLRALLTDPEMAALVQAPPMRRLLRPLCQMLGVEPPQVPKPASAPEVASRSPDRQTAARATPRPPESRQPKTFSSHPPLAGEAKPRLA
jgi:hypothetical protein